MENSIRLKSAERGATNALRRSRQAKHGERGIGLLMVLAVLVVIGGTLLTAVLSASEVERERDRATARALGQAKRALIDYAVSYAEIHSNSLRAATPQYVPGSLPCPEVVAPGAPEQEGRSRAPTGSPCGPGATPTNLLGRFPFADLRMLPLRDGDGQCLWYALSSSFRDRKYAPSPTLLNWDTPALFDVLYEDASKSAPVYLAGPDPSARAVAVIFAPGAPLPGKSPVPHANAAQCQGSYNASDYLDAVDGVDNAATPGAIGQAIIAIQSESFNDRVVYITAAEIFAEVERSQSFKTHIRKVMADAAKCVVGFARYHQTRPGGSVGDKRLPWAAPIPFTALNLYNADSSYRDIEDNMAGRFPYDVRNSCSETRELGSCPANERVLLTDVSDVSPGQPYYCSTWDQADRQWYRNWKDHWFYAVSTNHRPETPSTTDPCSVASPCLTMNGGGQYAAVLKFAGKAINGHKRSALSEKQEIGNYLEGRNASNYADATGDEDYQSAAASATFNDILVCIDQDLNVVESCT
jgi:hypothetical protein